MCAMSVSDVPIVPSEEDCSRATESGRRLARFLDRPAGLRIHIDDGEGPGEVLDIPAPALRLLTDILAEMARGRPVIVAPANAELTTQQAADHLNVSRPYLIKLLESGAIPFRMVGTHRRVAFRDLDSYKTRDDSERSRVLDELVAQAQELDMGY